MARCPPHVSLPKVLVQLTPDLCARSGATVPLVTAPDPNALMARVAEGDRAAFAELFQHFGPRLQTFYLRGGCRPDQANDLVQEVMLIVWRRADRFDPKKASAGTWIYTIARNKRIDRIRRERRPEPDPEDPAFVKGEPVQADVAVDASLVRQRLLAAIDELPEQQAHVVRAAYLEGKTLSVIAEELDKPLGTIKSRMRLAMQRLRSSELLEGVTP